MLRNFKYNTGVSMTKVELFSAMRCYLNVGNMGRAVQCRSLLQDYVRV